MPTPNDPALEAPVPARTIGGRWRDLFTSLVTVLAVGMSVYLTGYQVWRMRAQLGAHSVLDAVLMTAALALIPTAVVHQLARTWANRWVDWFGVLLTSAVALVFAWASRDYLAALGVDRPWSGALGLTFIAALGPLWLATVERERRSRVSNKPAEH